MSGMFGKSANSSEQQIYTGIQVSTSLYGGVVPYVAGRQRIPFNLLWYGNFVATGNNSGGSKGGGGSGTKSYTYSTAFIAGLCLGAITGIGRVWHDKALETLTTENLTFSLGGTAPAIWSGYPPGTPAVQKIPYAGLAYVASSVYNLGSSASMPNLTFEVDGPIPGYSIAHGVFDADPSAVITDYLTDPVRGAGFVGTIAPLTGVTNSYQAYCMSLGLLLSPFEDTQRTANTFVQELLQITNSDAVLSVGNLKIIPYADQPVSGTTPDGVSWSYTPNLTPLFIFTDNDYVVSSPGTPPVKLTIKPLADTYNIVSVEYSDRSNFYNTAPAGASDISNIAVTGRRVMPNLSFHQITTATVAKTVAQLILQSNLYEINTYQFQVRADFSLLEPMDYIAINDKGLALVNQVCRILQVDDDGSDVITIRCVEIPGAVRSTPQYNWNAAQGYAANYAAAPGSVVTPNIFRMPSVPAALTAGITLGIAVGGLSSSAFWGGCNVYLSVDGGSTYVFVGNVTNAGKYGTLSANIAAVADPDSTSTLSVALANTTEQLSTAVTHAEADTNQTLILVGSGTTAEVMSYGTASLISAGNYNLSYLRRNLYGSANQSHLSGANFARLDGNIFQIPFDPGYAGKTVLFKFASFNTWGAATEDLSAVTPYSYTIPAVVDVNAALNLIGRGVTVNSNNVFKSAGTSAWDSDVYSLQGYTNGAFVSFQPAQAGLALMIGLNTDPTTDSSYTSLDYAMYCMAAGTLQVYNNGTLAFTGGAYAAGDKLLVAYDGAFVRYLQNGAVIFQQPAPPNLSLFLDSSFFDPQAAATNVQFGPYGTATPVLWVPRGFMNVSDEAFSKTPGSGNAFDTDAYSINGYPTCHIVAKFNDLGSEGGIALVPQGAMLPALPGFAGYTHYLFLTPGNTINIIESGTVVSSGTPCVPTDFLSIAYDGTTVTYAKNLVPITTATDAGKIMYGVVDIVNAGNGWNSVEFGPGVLIPLADTPQLGLNAATTTSTASLSRTAGSFTSPTTLGSITVGPFPINTTVILTVTGQWSFSFTGGTITNIVLRYGISTTTGTFTGALITVDQSTSANNTTIGAGPLSQEIQVSLPAGTTTTYNMLGGMNPSGIIGSAITITGTIKAEVIKR